MTEVEVKEIVVRLDRLQEEMQRLAEKVDQLAPQRLTISTGHPYIVRVEGVCGGWPTVRGTRITVQAIVEKIRLGQTPEEIVASYPERLTLAHVYDALSYYHENPEEIEAQIAANRVALAEVAQLQKMRVKAREQA